MSQTKEKFDFLLLNRSDLWLLWRCHGIPRIHCYYFCLEPTMRNDNWIKTTFSKRAFWKLLDHSYVQSSFWAITRHIYNNLLKDTLRMNIFRIWFNIHSKFFIKTLVNVMKRKSMKVPGKRSVAQNPIVHFGIFWMFSTQFTYLFAFWSKFDISLIMKFAQCLYAFL